MLVWARTDDPEPLQGAFLVEAGTPGYRVERTWESLGMRATRSDDVVFRAPRFPSTMPSAWFRRRRRRR